MANEKNSSPKSDQVDHIEAGVVPPKVVIESGGDHEFRDGQQMATSASEEPKASAAPPPPPPDQ